MRCNLPTASQKNPRLIFRISYRLAGSFAIVGAGIAGQSICKLITGSGKPDKISDTLETLEQLTADDFASLNRDDLRDAVVRLDLARDRAEQVKLER